MKLGKLHIGWRLLWPDEVEAFGLSDLVCWRGLFIEYGDEDSGFGVCLRVKAQS